VEVVGGL